MDDTSLRLTPLHGEHVALGARMMPFAGFDMPVQYGSIIDEHFAVRRAAGLFDVSHMGEVMVRGPHAAAFIQRLVSNDVTKLDDGKAMYSVMCRPDGGIVDDLLVYRFAEREYMLVINAANVAGDFAWMREQNLAGAELEDISDRTALLAIQGPRAFEIVAKASGLDLADLAYYRFVVPPTGSFLGLDRVILSHTGYTGERGLEIYCDPDDAVRVWRALLEAGRESGLVPTGLGARDTLRLEAGYCLYGNDITTETNPLEAGLGWVTKLDKDFVGSDALRAVKTRGPARRLVAFVLEERGIPRHGYEIADSAGTVIGEVTSGTQSPVLGKGIGMGYVPNDASFTAPGSRIHVLNRGKAMSAVVAKPPLHKVS